VAIKCPKCHLSNPDTSRFCADCGIQLPFSQDIHPEVTETLQTSIKELTTGSTFAGHYQVIKELGKGGMGIVYLAHDTSLDRKVAIKFLPENCEQDQIAKKRFLREARSAASLDHPYVCSIYEVGEAEGKDFIVMEYVEGRTLKEKLESGPLPLKEALKTAAEVAESLEKANLKGIIHRDLKPSNIMFTSEGHAKVMDFGLAKQLMPIGRASQEETLTAMTREHTTVGTLAYMSPEQLKGEELDHSSDVFSFGVVLCEMLTGVHPFKKDAGVETASAILHETTILLPMGAEETREQLQQLVSKMLVKNPRERIPIQEVRANLVRLIEQISAQQVDVSGKILARSWKAFKRPYVIVPVLIALSAFAYLIIQRLEFNKRVTWAESAAIPEIERLADKGDLVAAFNLALQAERYIPNRKSLTDLWPRISSVVNVNSNPPGARVSWKSYAAVNSDWKYLGLTPIQKIRIPGIFCRLKFEKEGYRTVHLATPAAESISTRLDKDADIPSEMVRVPGGKPQVRLACLDQLQAEEITDFLIDEYEVTNKAFKGFVNSGGYRDKKHWKFPFLNDARVLSWEEAMDKFKDKTGRPGPAAWEAGDYPEGEDDYPVSGVSWYEAAAYAEFAGKSLPTIFHWNAAAGVVRSSFIIPQSNFGSHGPARVGSYQGMNPFGTYDMGGNVREWCFNESSLGKQRFILGGGWNDPTYQFFSAYAQLPFDRSAINGFRCIRYLEDNKNQLALARTIEVAFRDFMSMKPVSDETFKIFLRQYAYDKTPLNARRESMDDSAEDWIKEKITFYAGYGNDRMIAYLFLPKSGTPPYQTVVVFPGDSGILIRSSEPFQWTSSFDFFLKSGRAVLYPIYKSTFDRGDGLESSIPNETNLYKEHVIMWAKDLSRSIDYLETRPEIDAQKLAYFGVSWGGRMGGLMLAVEKRFSAAVLYVAGLRFQKSLPEADPFNFVPRVTLPVLLLNGRYDNYFPVETSQKPMFTLLGTRKEDKKWIVVDGGHFVPRDRLIQESLAWLDRYLGPSK
jgi:serine/threonine protein kinase/dienelactone hydrolase